MLKTSVIVCAHTEKRWALLIETVESLLRQTTPARQLILIIDNNADLLRRCQQEFSHQGVLVAANSGSGLSDARNTGVAMLAPDVDIVAFIDDDAVAAPDWITQHVAAYDDADEAHIISAGGYIVPRWESTRPSWFPDEFNWVVGCSYRGSPTTRQYVRNGIGCNMSFRRKAFENGRGFKLGRKGGTVAINNDDTEFCIRLAQEVPGAKVLYLPDARVDHFVPIGRTSVKFFLERCYSEGRSKAILTQMVGSDQSLSNERTYTLNTLPAGVLRGIGDGIRLQFSGFARAAMIVLGLCSTGLGFALTSAQLKLRGTGE
jgi:glycosyltransferase involved in cell wall biosynthesis